MYKFSLRHDQAVLIIEALDYLIMFANKRIGNGTVEAFDQLTSEQFKSRAIDIRDYLQDMTG